MDKSEREIYYEYRTIKEKEICQACPKCLVRFKEFVGQKLYLDKLGMDKSEREIYYEYRTIKEKEICQECPICLSTILECSKKGRSKKEYKVLVSIFK